MNIAPENLATTVITLINATQVLELENDFISNNLIWKLWMLYTGCNQH